ncbi:putative ASCH domain-containing protein [uncultured Gammaproteobacteria bacterium]
MPADTGFSSLWTQLHGHGHLWHCTSLKSLESILRDRKIVPNEGQFPATYSQSNASLGRRIGAVSLFDFDTEAESSVREHIWDYTLRGVLIRIWRDALDQTKLLLPSQVGKLASEYGQADINIPYVEALHRGPIYVSAFIGFILMTLNPLRWIKVQANDDAISILTDADKRWKDEDELKREEAHAREERSLAELVEESMSSRATE